jgi:hypothetical protein
LFEIGTNFIIEQWIKQNPNKQPESLDKDKKDKKDEVFEIIKNNDESGR